MKGLIISAFAGFIGFVLGIYYTVQAADSSLLVRFVAVIKGVIAHL